jgi:hypothetical protein
MMLKNAGFNQPVGNPNMVNPAPRISLPRQSRNNTGSLIDEASQLSKDWFSGGNRTGAEYITGVEGWLNQKGLMGKGGESFLEGVTNWINESGMTGALPEDFPTKIDELLYPQNKNRRLT